MRSVFKARKLIVLFVVVFLGGILADHSTNSFAQSGREPAVKIELTDYAQALCNDGSPAVIFFHPGEGRNADNWIIFLGGGGQCTSVAECRRREERMPELMTSNFQPEERKLFGILSNNSETNPDFFDFNQVYIEYCSSDSWTGTNDASDATGGWHFKGRFIIEAAILTLLDGTKTDGKSLLNANEVVFGGVSAGSTGAQNNLDFVGGLLPETVRLRGLFDSHWRPDGLREAGLIQGENDEVVAAIVALWAPRNDQSCIEELGEASRCIGEALLPYLNHEVFVFVDQADNIIAPLDRWDETETEQYLQMLRESLLKVSGAFSSQQGIHGSVTNQPFFDLDINGIKYKDVIANWFYDREGQKTVIDGE